MHRQNLASTPKANHERIDCGDDYLPVPRSYGATRRSQINQAAPAPSLSPENPIFHDPLREMVRRLAAAAVPDPETAALVLLQRRVEKQALARSFSQTLAELAVFIAVGLVFVPLLPPAGRPSLKMLQNIHAIVERMRGLRKS